MGDNVSSSNTRFIWGEIEMSDLNNPYISRFIITHGDDGLYYLKKLWAGHGYMPMIRSTSLSGLEKLKRMMEEEDERNQS